MVKPPKIRHSKSRNEPMTIELGPDEVTRIDATKADEPAAAATAMAAEPAASEPTPVETGAAQPSAPAEEAREAATGDASQPDAAETNHAAEKAAEDDDARFMGSEWPPEPAAAGEGKPAEDERAGEERVAHAFGRDPDTPPPGGGRVDMQEPPIRATPEPRRSGLSAIAAGIIGGVITLVGAGALQFAGVLPSPGTGAPAAGDDEAVAALRTELTALKEDVEEVKAASSIDSSGLTKTVTDLSSSVQGLSGALDQVKADVASLKSAVAQGGGGDGAAMETLNGRIAELEKAVAALGQAGPGASQEAIDAITQKIAAVEQAAASAAESARAGESRLAALEQSVASLTEQVSQQAAQPKVALAIAGAALKSAIERGGPFTTEVETFAAIAPDAPELPALREIAAKGVASHADLVAGMNDVANAMVEAAEPVDQDADFWDELLASAESLVHVRPIGEVEGETVPAKVARMEVAVKAGELTKALAEFDALPETSKAAGRAFADLIRTRVTAEELVAKALAGALKAA